MIWQKIGTGLLGAALILWWLGEIGCSWIVLAGVGLIDLQCVINKDRTVSQYIQDLTENKVIDYAVMGIIMGVVFHKFLCDYGWVAVLTYSLPCFIMWLALHLFGNKD